MKATKAKKKVLLTDTQAIDLLLAKMDLQFAFADEVQDKVNKNHNKKNSEPYTQSIPVLSSLNKLSSEKRISFMTLGSHNKKMLWRLRQFTQNKNNQFDPSLLSLINAKISVKNNKVDAWSYLSDNDEIKLNINPSWLITEYVPEMFFLKSFIPLYIEQLNKLAKTKYLINTDELIKTFLKDAKLAQWKEKITLNEKNKNIIREYTGEFNNINEALINIISIGIISKWKNKNETLIERAAIKLFEHVEGLFVLELYHDVL